MGEGESPTSPLSSRARPRPGTPRYPERPHTGRHRTAELTSELDEPQARARVIADLRRNGVDIARAPSEALTDFIESCAAAYNPARDPMLRERGRYSKRNKEHARMLRRK